MLYFMAVIIVSIVVIGCIIILRFHCRIQTIQYNLRIMIQPITADMHCFCVGHAQ